MSGSASALAEVERRGFARRGTLNLVGAVGSAVLNLGLTVAVTRNLPTSEAGAFFAATSLFLLLVGVGRLGGGTGLVYWVSRLRALERARLVRACLRYALAPVVLVSTALGAALFVGADWTASLLTGSGGDSGDLSTALRWLACFLPFAALLDGVLGATRGFHTMKPTVLVDRLLRPCVQLLAVLALASLGMTAVVVAWAAPYLPALLLGSGWLARLLPVRQRGRRDSATEDADSSLAGDYWRFTWPRAVSGLLQVALQRLDVVLVTVLLDPDSAALYVVASRLLVLGSFGVQAVAMAVQPQAAAYFVRDERHEVAELYQLSTTWLMLLTWPIYLVGIVFAPTVLSLFGPQYTQGSDVLIVLALATLLSTACGVVDVMLTMAGRTSWILGNVTVALVVNVALNMLLIPRIGIMGAAVAWAGAIAVNNLLPLLQMRWALGIQPFGRGGLEAALVSVMSWVPACLLARELAIPSPARLVVGVVLGGVLYLGLVWWRRRALSIDPLLSMLRRRGTRQPQEP